MDPRFWVVPGPDFDRASMCSKTFGCAILIVPRGEGAFPVTHGAEPVGFEVEHGLRVDAGRFELLCGWFLRFHDTSPVMSVSPLDQPKITEALTPVLYIPEQSMPPDLKLLEDEKAPLEDRFKEF